MTKLAVVSAELTFIIIKIKMPALPVIQNVLMGFAMAQITNAVKKIVNNV